MSLFVPFFIVTSFVACSSDDSGSTSTVVGGPDASTGAADSASPVPEAGTGDSGADAGNVSLGTAPFTLVYATAPGGIDMRTATAATFDGTSLVSYTANANEMPEIGTNQAKDVATDAFVFSGRWAGGSTAGKFYNINGTGTFAIPVNGGFHYAIGNGADPLPSTGAATYTLTHATPVTVGDGSKAPGTATGQLGATFAGAASTIGWSVTLDVPGDGTYTIATAGGAANTATSEAAWQANIKGAFYGNLAVTSAGAACSGGASCSGGVRGLVGGVNGDRVALAVQVYAGGGGRATSVSSVLVFTKQ